MGFNAVLFIARKDESFMARLVTRASGDDDESLKLIPERQDTRATVQNRFITSRGDAVRQEEEIICRARRVAQGLA